MTPFLKNHHALFSSRIPFNGVAKIILITSRLLRFYKRSHENPRSSRLFPPNPTRREKKGKLLIRILFLISLLVIIIFIALVPVRYNENNDKKKGKKGRLLLLLLATRSPLSSRSYETKEEKNRETFNTNTIPNITTSNNNIYRPSTQRQQTQKKTTTNTTTTSDLPNLFRRGNRPIASGPGDGSIAYA